jgi:hypothetical protein
VTKKNCLSPPQRQRGGRVFSRQQGEGSQKQAVKTISENKSGHRLLICGPICLIFHFLLIPIKQTHLIVARLFNLEWQREVPRALQQQVAGRLLA